MSVQGDIQFGVNFLKPLVARYSRISGERETKPTLPGMASNYTAQTCADYQSFEDNGSSGVVQSVVEKLKNRDSGRGVGDILEIPNDAE